MNVNPYDPCSICGRPWLTSTVHENVFIDALCLFDTVASLGVPKVGAGAYVAPILRILPAFRKDFSHLENIVRHPPQGNLMSDL
jgi:hypothetical protein